MSAPKRQGRPPKKARKDPGATKEGRRFYVVFPGYLLEQILKEAKTLGSQRSAPQHVIVRRLKESFEQRPPEEIPHANAND